MFYSRIEKHSVNPQGQELLSFVVTYPRSILPEFNTHTIISKNTSSSRAIPYEYKGTRKDWQPPSMREMVLTDPYLPLYYGRNERGMQATQELDQHEREQCIETILRLRDSAVAAADDLWHIGLHKQDCNRYIEPWAWTTQVLTGTHWANFFALRTHKDAHPAFRHIARRMYLQYKASKPTLLLPGQWHLPFVEDTELDLYNIKDAQVMSVARCARLSYTTHDTGERSLEADYRTYEKLNPTEGPKHMSPFGHQGTPAQCSGVVGGRAYYTDWIASNFQGWNQLRKFIPNENILKFEPSEQEILEWGVND